MSIQFRKRFKLFPGVSINLGKQGLSLSAGVKGARITVGKDRTTTSVGLPGTGLYDRNTVMHKPVEKDRQNSERRALFIGILFIAFLIGAAKLLSMI